MHTLLSTDNLPEPKKFPYWREFLCDYYYPAEIYRTSDDTFEAEISEIRLGDLTMTLVHACGYNSNSHETLKLESRKRTVFVLQQLSGTAFFHQDSRSATVGPNDIICLDNTRPLAITIKGDYKQLLLHVPYDLWEQRFGRTEPLTVRALRSDSLMGSLVANYLRQIPSLEAQVDSMTASRLEETTLSLLGTAFGSFVINQKSSQSTSRTALLYRAKSFIDQNLNDPDLNTKKVAAFLRISESYLQALFRDENQSVSNWIWKMRLEKCRRDIANPLLAGKSLSEIAFSFGFNSFSHFSRKFKETFKMTASEYRRGYHPRHS